MKLNKIPAQAKQVLFLALWSFLCVAPNLSRIGPNIVALTYAEGASRFWSGVLPYQPAGPGADVFHYPLFFAFAYFPFLALPSTVSVLLWAFLNSIIFWLGVSAWIQLSRRSSKWEWIAILLLAIELDISLRYQQVNALVIGLLLFGVKKLVSEGYKASAACLALAGHIKVFPFIVAGYLYFRRPIKGVLLFVLMSLVVGFLPLLEISWAQWFEWQKELLFSATGDLERRALLDIHSTFSRWGYATVGAFIRDGVLGWTLALSILLPVFLDGKKFPALEWLALVLSAFLLCLPRVESPTFIFLAPAYLLLTTRLAVGFRSLVLMGMISTSLVYTSPWRSLGILEWVNANWNSKPVGALALWSVAATLLTGTVFKAGKDLFHNKVFVALVKNGWRGGLPTWIFLCVRWALTPYSRMMSTIQPRGRILDFGCGHGLFSALIASQSSSISVVAVDHDARRVTLGKKLFRDLPNISWRNMDESQLNFSEYETVVALDVLHYFSPEEQERFLRQVHKELLVGGQLIFREVDPKGGVIAWWNQFYERCATKLSLTRTKSKSVYVRQRDEWSRLLTKIGFRSTSETCSHPLFSDVLFRAVKV